MDLYTACSIVEGFSGEEHSEEEQIQAWQYLIDTGHAWTLQGWYGRNANELIERGICRPSHRGQIFVNGKKINLPEPKVSKVKLGNKTVTVNDYSDDK